MTLSRTLLIGFAAVLALFAVAMAIVPNDESLASTAPRIPALERAVNVVLEHGVVDTVFVRSLVALPITRFDSGLVRINVTNFAKKTDYSHNHNAYSIKQVRKFLVEHDKLLREAEAKYSVPKQAIASILWVETKYGRYTGSNHIASVYLSVVLSAEKEFVEQSVDRVLANAGLDSTKRDSIRTIVQAKASKKVRWAIDQLAAMHTMHTAGTVDVTTLRGSWAGAFGLSQFLPASYVRWAKDGNADGRIDLYDMSDAIHSVANYLKENGWGATVKQQRAAVFHYNNSDPYVDAVLTLAEKVR